MSDGSSNIRVRRRELEQIFARAARIPPRTRQSDDELLGYNEFGAFDDDTDSADERG